MRAYIRHSSNAGRCGCVSVNTYEKLIWSHTVSSPVKLKQFWASVARVFPAADVSRFKQFCDYTFIFWWLVTSPRIRSTLISFTREAGTSSRLIRGGGRNWRINMEYFLSDAWCRYVSAVPGLNTSVMSQWSTSSHPSSKWYPQVNRETTIEAFFHMQSGMFQMVYTLTWSCLLPDGWLGGTFQLLTWVNPNDLASITTAWGWVKVVVDLKDAADTTQTWQKCLMWCHIFKKYLTFFLKVSGK